MSGNVCARTAIILNKDITEKLEKCFENYRSKLIINLIENSYFFFRRFRSRFGSKGYCFGKSN